MNYHSGLRYQRGRGLGSLFSGLFKGFAPLARLGFSAGKKLLSSDLVKNVTSSALESGKPALKNITADLLEGKDVSQTAREELANAKKKLAGTLRGSGKHRKRKYQQKQKPKRKTTKRQKLKYNLLDDDY